MAENRITAFFRALDEARSRRATVAGSLVGLASLGGGLAPHAAEGRKKKRKKKRKKPKPPSCQASCDDGCDFCFTRAAGPLLCGNLAGGAIGCTFPCSSDNDCVGTPRPYCVTRIETRATGAISAICTVGGSCVNPVMCDS